MGAHRLTRWQKASALVPMAILVGAWGAALTNTGLASASSEAGSAGVPDVPATAFDQPASVQSGNPSGIDDRAGAVGALSTLSANGIPAASLLGYRRAETLLGKADPSCKLPWTLIAAIGRVESNHGRTGGNAVNSNGSSTPGIFGIPLNGANNTTKVNDTDNGSLDKDKVFDRAVGPMQFIPGTWKSVGVDADGTKGKDPQDIDDAATAAGVYLCAGEGDLSSRSGASAAVMRYNHSGSYVDLVLSIAAKYAEGDFTQSPNGHTSSTVLTSKSHDQTMTPAERKKAQRAENNSNNSGSGGGSSGGGDASGGSGGSGGSGDPVGGIIGSILTPFSKPPTTTNDPAPDPVKDTLTKAEATKICKDKGILNTLLNPTALADCVAKLLD